MIPLLFALALAAPEDALPEPSRAFYLQAVAAEDARRFRAAAASYRLVLSADSAFLPAALGLGRALEALGERSEAEALYRSLGEEADAVEALARLVEARSPAEALTLWRRLESLRLGDPSPFQEQARILAATDPEAALAAFERHRTLLQGREPDADVVVAVGVGLLDGDFAAEAEALWRGYLDAFPEGRAAEELRARLDRMEVERAAAALAFGGSEPLPAALASRYAAAQAAYSAGRDEEAEALARALVAEAPRAAEARALLADVLVARAAWDEAEIHGILARALAPEDAANRVRLGLLLVEAYGGRRDREAAEELREAGTLRPGDPEVQLALGRVLQRLQDWTGARAALEAALAAGATGPAEAEARERIAALLRVPPEPPPMPASSEPEVPAEARRPYRLAYELTRRGRAREAVAELDAALALAPEAPPLLNLRARLARELGAHAEAETWLLRSRKADPTQPGVLLELAHLARKRGDVAGAETLLREAAEQGSPDARFYLAQLAAQRDDWRAVREELAAYEAGAPGRTSLNAAAAAGLRAEVGRRVLTERIVGIGLLVVSVGVPLGVWLRWRTGCTLRDLLDGAPECWHDAARLLSALRHEVLKHNTTVLPDIADALARGDAGPWEAFRVRAPELLAHFRRYLDELEALGRRYGMRLGLRGRDPILGPMHRALAKLARARRPRPDEVMAASAAINGEGYQAIGRIVREICVLPVDADRVRAVYARVGAEPGFGGAPLPALDVHTREAGLAVRMFRADLEDILANLLRNALAAGARRLAVELGAFDDPITGHAWVEVAVADDAPGTLTNAMIRGRYIGRGLGLAVDLINRHGGSIRVEARGEGEKALVVQLPSVEAAPVEVEWTVA